MISRLAFFTSGDEDNNPYVGILIMITAPIAAFLIQMAISRSREYAADATGASYAHNPLGLASALEKLHASSGKRKTSVNPATAHMFIVNPLTSKGVASWFSTHPPVDERIQRLKSLTGGVAS